MNDIILKQAQNLAYLQAAEAYCNIVWPNGKKLLVCKPLKFFANSFESLGWWRIHRSYLINPSFLAEISKEKDFVFMLNGQELPIARRQRTKVKTLFKKNNP